MIPGYVEFEFNLPDALLAQLVGVFDKIEPAPLVQQNILKVPEEQGVYQLFHAPDSKPDLVYVGKTDSDSGLRARLNKHGRKIQHRVGLDPANVLFKAVRVFVFTAVDLEAQLIRHYGGVSNVPWNGSGFGSNDPGKERDTTTYKDEHYDTQFPIDVERPIEFEVPMSASAADILRSLKAQLPYLIRFEVIKRNSRTGHEDLETTQVTLNSASSTTPTGIIKQVISALPKGWHATMLPSHIIIYKNDRRKFPSGRRLADS